MQVDPEAVENELLRVFQQLDEWRDAVEQELRNGVGGEQQQRLRRIVKLSRLLGTVDQLRAIRGAYQVSGAVSSEAMRA